MVVFGLGLGSVVLDLGLWSLGFGLRSSVLFAQIRRQLGSHGSEVPKGAPALA